MMTTGACRICCIAALMAACSLSYASLSEDKTIDEISVFRSPGKPTPFVKQGQPGEQITAKREGRDFVLIVSNNVGIFHEEKASLDPDEWARLLALIRQQKLLDFQPQLQDGRVFDFGSEGFRIKAEHLVTQKWLKPLNNGHRPTLLFQRLAKLAKKKIPQVRLYYLTPDLQL
jgi:hypothetical protein